ncbi:putative 1-phosphatidylinositol-3-phosphate 5-kinase FAB1D [Olea europaea var. sylvestris]|uniref:putative 1-phosphatidylinositol-3-phosphate 5-kinase FAB1D n=3 Tax=Olea europaea var. sylvestris TaxID=158386 RepID=UPI000C1D7F4F|nr:putative 1-phosphatidylinositol-3-phosphate 5-kinase FAB1D [Olea europaea var. sylvestris]
MPSISPTASLISSDSYISNCSDFSVDANFFGRGYVEDSSTDSTQEDSVSGSKGHLDHSNSSVKLNGFHRTGVENVGIGGIQTGQENNGERVGSSTDEEIGISDEMDAQFWLPPEPEDQEDDNIGRVENYDDDEDECGEDGVRWANSSSLSCFGEEGSGSYKFKEEKRKAMDEVMNGKFKALVGQLIKSVGVASSGNDGENWVDIVTSLSWEAAAFVKPGANEGKAMDPDGYVKIKCIATGSRSQSRLIKGCVFKKHAAHKHMPTKYKNPRLMLINGSLDLSSSGLSSFESMQQEKDILKSIVERIEMYRPNVILVEKSVSRGIQESILAKGMTLVFDMKLHRLERVARCTGSRILSSDFASGQQLRQCDSFQIEKFVEEHNVLAEGGKKPSKTLMFLEGCATRLGCTILLMGANGNELKRIKCVFRCAVVMAYHLMLETSFLLDQRAMFSTIPLNKVVYLALTDQQLLSIDTDKITVFCQENKAETDSSLSLDIPISDGLYETVPRNLISLSESNSSISFEPYSPATFPGLSLSESLKKVMDDSFPLFYDSSRSMSSQLGYDGRNHEDHVEDEVKKSSSVEVMDHNDTMPILRSEGHNLLSNVEPHLPPVCSVESLDRLDNSDKAEDQMNNKDEISSVLDSESILVLMSKRNASSGTVCEQSHFSHIKFYRNNFDDPLGKFLRENLLNQGFLCKTCGKPPVGHFFYYAHHNKQLTIQVRRLPDDKGLPGETEGKLWMWSRCGQCKFQNGSSKSTKRVLISTDARGLSFGKFLELNFSNHSSFNCPSSCGHSFHRDFLYFFGSGPMVAVFKYSPVATYSVSLPHKMLDFNSSLRGEFLKEDFKKVLAKGNKMFLEIEESLKSLKTQYVGLTLNIQGKSKKFSDIEEMLKQEKSQFEVDIQNAVENGSRDEPAYKLLSLNRVRLELLLESCVWDQRLHSLSSGLFASKSIKLQVQEQPQLKEDGADGEVTGADIKVENCDSPLENIAGLEIKLVTSMEANDFTIKEIPIDGQVEVSREHDESFPTSITTDDIAGPTVDGSNGNESSVHHFLVKPSFEVHPEKPGSTGKEKIDKGIPVAADIENDEGLIWTPYSVIQHQYMNNLQQSYSQKFESLSHYAAELVAHELITDEGSRLHIPLGTDEYIVSDYEDEFSSIIACALTLLKNPPTAAEELVTSNWPSFSSLDSDGSNSSSTNASEESHSSSFNGSDLLDSLKSYGADHPQVSMGSKGKHKYSVICLYASEFRQLRDRCCPSEVDYIASLSRCRNWDAKGGKSKSFFAKTLDDRLIIKEIKRTEFDSFMKFAPNYFKYMDQCYELHNPTCLAKVLGIYQVIVRATKNGKETKHDLLVMENLSFGRNITKQYDLKGALHARFNSAGNGSGDVLLDQNFVNDMNDSPLYISMKSKRNLQRAVWNDTTFLHSINVMDYSLLVGVDTQRRELVCGIIDYLRQYTWDKQLENWVKSSLVVPKNQQPTVISPKEYKKRFRKFMDTHFLCVPDHWCSHRLSNPCKLCGTATEEENGSLHLKPRERGDYDDDSRPLAKSLEQPKHADKSRPSSPNHGRNGFSA